MSVLRGFFILIVFLLGLFFGALTIVCVLLMFNGYRGWKNVTDLCGNINKVELICSDPDFVERMEWVIADFQFGFWTFIFTAPLCVLLLGSGVYLVKRSRRMNRELREGKHQA